MLQAVFFDFDGTISDTVSQLREAINMTMQKHGYPERTQDEVLSFINNGARELVRRAMPEYLQSDEALVDHVLADYQEAYSKVYLKTERTYEGVDRLIAQLHAQGLRIAVLSNKPDRYMLPLCEQVLEPGSFDVAQGALPQMPTKPHPYLSELVAKKLGVALDACVMVGDSDVDLATANNAGVPCISVLWGFRTRQELEEAGATIFCETPADLKELVDRLAASLS